MYFYPMQTVLITGGTGMIGKALTTLFLEKGYKVIVLTRKDRKSRRLNVSFAKWDVEKGMIDASAIQAANIIVHLAGEGVADKRWSEKRKQAIVDSRVQSGNLLVKALRDNQHQVSTFIETDPADDSYLGNTCQLWEQSTAAIPDMGIRLVTLRIGIVFNKKGGALAEFIKPAQFGLATILGTGKQIVSWIHQKDLCNMMLFAAENKKIEGVYNAVAPEPISNKKLVLAISKKTYPIYLPVYVPSFALKIILGEMSVEVLKSAKVSAQKIQAAGFVFDYPTVEEALTDLLK